MQVSSTYEETDPRIMMDTFDFGARSGVDDAAHTLSYTRIRFSSAKISVRKREWSKNEGLTSGQVDRT